MAKSPLRADGAKIKAARDAKGWSQERLAEKAGYKVSVVQKLEQGTYFSVRCLECCAEAIDVLVGDLLVSSDQSHDEGDAFQAIFVDWTPEAVRLGLASGLIETLRGDMHLSSKYLRNLFEMGREWA